MVLGDGTPPSVVRLLSVSTHEMTPSGWGGWQMLENFQQHTVAGQQKSNVSILPRLDLSPPTSSHVAKGVEQSGAIITEGFVRFIVSFSQTVSNDEPKPWRDFTVHQGGSSSLSYSAKQSPRWFSG